MWARAGLGALVWCACVSWREPSWAMALLWLGALIVAPLALGALERQPLPAAARVIATLRRAVLPAALLLVAGMSFELLAWLVLPWVALGALCGAFGLWRVAALGLRRPGVFADFGLFWFAGSGAWVGAYAFEFALLEFAPIWVLLTAAHQLFIGLALQGAAACVVAARPGRISWAAAILVTAGNPLVAAGIECTKRGGPAWLEFGAVCIFVAGAIVLGWVQLFHALAPSSRLPWYSRALLVISDLSLGTAMTLAVIYAWGTVRGYPTMDIPQMVTWHATLNAVGFALCGLIGWTLATPRGQATMQA